MSSDPGILAILWFIPITVARTRAPLVNRWLFIAPTLNQVLTAIPKALAKGAQAPLKIVKGVGHLIANLTTTAHHLLANAGPIQW